MRILVPSARDRRRLYGIMLDSFAAEDIKLCKIAMGEVAAKYHLPPPKILWAERSEVLRATLGACYEDGTIELVHPEWWARRRACNDPHTWVKVAYHELGHYVLWAQAEKKADTFCDAMLAGVGQ